MGAVLLSALVASGVAGCEDAETTNNTGGSGGSTGGAGGAGGSGGSGGAGGGPTAIQIPGQSAPVSVVYDQAGLVHLSCSTDEDCFAALGYFHAANRFFFMDFVRNLVRGRLGSLVKAGATVLEQDYANRQFFSTAAGEPLEDKLYADGSEEAKGYMDAYTRGVNAWIGDMRAGRNGATLTTEYDFALLVKEAIRDWEPADSAAIGLYVLNDLSNNSDDELSNAQVFPAFPAELAVDLFSAKPLFDAYTQPLFAPPPPPSQSLAPLAKLASLGPLLGAAREKLALVGSGVRSKMPGDTGSNNWVVGPSRTSGAGAILANDPHLPLSNPSIWFPVEIDAKSNGTGVMHVAGSTFPGLPAVMVGHNETVSWGVTTAYWDLADVYVEELSADGKSVVFNGEEVAIIEKELEFEDVEANAVVKKTFRWVPHHGPIVSEDLAAGTAISIRWRGHEGGTDLDAFFGLAKAQDLAEAKAAIGFASSASQNFVVADQAGDIGWFPYSKLPKRAWASKDLPPWLPLPGDGSAEWDGFVPFDDLPQLTNPPDDAIASANADMTGASADGDLLNDGQEAIQAYRKADGTRQQRILDLLASGGDAHSVQSMLDMQGDTYMLFGDIVVPPVLAAAEGATLSTDEQAVIDALKAWLYTCPTGLDGSDPKMAPDSADPTDSSESIGCTAFHAVFYSIVNEAFADEIAAAGTSAGGWEVGLVARALKDPAQIVSGDLFWDDVNTPDVVETRDDILLRAVSFAASRLAVSGGPNTWRWGRFHTLSLRSIFDSFGIVTYNAPAVAAPGGHSTVNVATPRRSYPAEGKPWDFHFRSGPSVRFVVQMSPEGPRMSYQLPGGTDLHRDSPFYNNLLPAWLKNEPIEFPFGPGAVTDPAVSLEVLPAP